MLPLALLPLLCTGDASARPDSPFPHPTTVLFDVDPDGAVWASGRSYKASLNARGFTFVPFRGSSAPRNEPLGLRFAGADIGGQPITVDGGARVDRAAQVMSVHRGPVRERFRCASEGVELIVEVDVPPGLEGDLRVDYAADGTYGVAVPGPRGGLRFRGELGEVHMGAAVAVEAHGRRTAVAIEPTEEGLRFTVPADAVARSRGRVVIDPFISSGEITSNPTRDDVSVDVTADKDEGFFVAVERAFSATDSDVFIYRVPSSGSLGGTFVSTVDFTTTSWEEPTIVGREARGDVLVAATRGAAPNREIWCRASAADGSAVGAPFFAMPGEEPDLCVETGASPFSPRWYVTGVDDGTSPSSLTRRIVGGSGTSVGTIGPVYRFTGSQDITHAAIGEVTGPTGSTSPTRFRVVISEVNGFGGRLRLLTFDRDSTLVSQTTLADVDIVAKLSVCSLGESNLGVGFPTFAVAYESFPAFVGGRQVHVLACSSGGATGDPVSVAELTNGSPSTPRRNPSIASDGARWSLSYEEVSGVSFPPTGVVLVEGTYAGGQMGLKERRIVLSSPFGGGLRPATCSMYAGGAQGSSARQTLTAFISGTATDGARSDPNPALAGGVQYCGAEPNSVSSSGAWLSAVGGTGSTTIKDLVLQDAPPGQFSLLLVASTTNFVPGISGSQGNLCLGPDNFGRYTANVGPINPSGRRIVIVSPGQIPQGTGFIAAQVGQSWYFQAWFRDVDGGVPTSNLSNGVKIRFDH